jgi:hypothetical protein
MNSDFELLQVLVLFVFILSSFSSFLSPLLSSYPPPPPHKPTTPREREKKKKKKKKKKLK